MILDIGDGSRNGEGGRGGIGGAKASLRDDGGKTMLENIEIDGGDCLLSCGGANMVD